MKPNNIETCWNQFRKTMVSSKKEMTDQRNNRGKKKMDNKLDIATDGRKKNTQKPK